MRSSEESTLRTVRPEAVSSASTFHGSSARRSSSSTPSAADRTDLWKAKFKMRSKPLFFKFKSGLPQASEHFRKVLLDEMRQHKAVVQRRSPADQAAFERRLSRTCKPARGQAASAEGPCAHGRHLERPQFEQARAASPRPSGGNSLSTQNSARCVLPVTSASKLRKSPSTMYGGQSLDGRWRKATSSSYRASMRASSTRGYWLVGPTYIPENRYDSDGWFCQNAIMLRSRSGRRRMGLSSTVAPPITMWLPPPVASRLPLKLNFSAVNRLRRASSSSNMLICSSSSQLLAGGRLISRTPGSGVTLKERSRGSAGGA